MLFGLSSTALKEMDKAVLMLCNEALKHRLLQITEGGAKHCKKYQKMNGRTHHATTYFWSKPSSDEQVRMPKTLFSTTFYENNPEKTWWINLWNSSVSIILWCCFVDIDARRSMAGMMVRSAATTFQSRQHVIEFLLQFISGRTAGPCADRLPMQHPLVPNVDEGDSWWNYRISETRGFQRNPD